MSEAPPTPTLDVAFQLGDMVRIKPGTLAWSGEPLLRNHVGRVLMIDQSAGQPMRLTVEFPAARKILPRRDASVFVLVERAYLTSK